MSVIRNGLSDTPPRSSHHAGPSISPAPIFRRSDALALATLVATSLVITIPFFFAQGHWTYLDNAVHIAEAYSLSNDAPGGWSEIGFCGFPLGTLHSPLWYGALSLIARSGIRIEPFYGAGLLAGFLAPPIALYLIARRTVTPFIAATLAYLLLVRRSAIIGPAAALAGMWTFYLAAAAFFILLDRLGRRQRNPLDIVITASLVGLIGLTHLFTLIAAAIVGGIHLVRSCMSADRVGRLKHDAIAGALGLMASSRYWLGAWFDTSWTTIPVHNRPVRLVFETLVLSPPLDGLPRSLRAWMAHPQTAADLATQVLLIGVGLSGAIFVLRRRPEHDGPLYGILLATVIMVMLIAVLPDTRRTILGPISWRFVYFVVQGLLLGAVPWLARFRGRWANPGPAVAALVAIAATSLAPLWGWQLWSRLPTNGQVTEVHELWDWLRDHHTQAWGRTYIQNMDRPHAPDNLMPSGVLALTAHESGVRQLGNYYDIVPFPVVHWTRSDANVLFGSSIARSTNFADVVTVMQSSNTTHVVTSDPLTSDLISRETQVTRLHQVGRFTVFERNGVTSRWAEPQTPGLTVDAVEHGVGHIKMQVTNGRDGGKVLVKEAFNPQWHVEGSGSTWLKPDARGLTVMTGIPAGTYAFDLRYRPSRLPLALTLGGWVAILFLGGVTVLRATRRNSVPLTRQAPAV